MPSRHRCSVPLCTTTLKDVPEIVHENPVTGVMSHIVVGDELGRVETYRVNDLKGELGELSIGPLQSPSKIETVTIAQPVKAKEEKPAAKLSYFTEFMSETEMLSTRYRERA